MNSAKEAEVKTRSVAQAILCVCITTPRTGRESAVMLTNVTLSQIPELSEFTEDDESDANDSEFDLL